MSWETVIGLEVHVQLDTRTKIFSGASTAFGAEPNTQACAIDVALPGTLPVLNEQALINAVMFGLAIDAQIGKRSVFERKNYFYPDLPKGYQTTQLAEPIVGPGVVTIELPDGSTKDIRIHHAHLEEDAGKSLHEDFHGMSGIDLNRAGTPLIEVVSEPDMRSSAEAVAFARKLHSIVTSLGICDGEMSQGSMRFDVNVSVRKKGAEKFGTRTETKNLNSFKFIEEAILLEVERQIEVLESGGAIVQETRLYDGDTKRARSMRSKEDANDYRYFPCPDLLPVVIDDATIEKIRASMPELPQARRARFIETFGLSDYDAGQLTMERAVADYFEEVAKQSGEAKLAANWVMSDLAAALNKHGLSIKESPITPETLAEIITRIKKGEIRNDQARKLFAELWDNPPPNIHEYTSSGGVSVSGASVTEFVSAKIESLGLKQITDTGAIEKLIDDILAQFPEQVVQYRAADEGKRKKLSGFFVGPVMKATKGQASPQVVNEILAKKLNG